MGWDPRAAYWNVGRVLEYFSGVIAALVPVSLVSTEYYAIPGVLGSALLTFFAGVGFRRAGVHTDERDRALNYTSAAAVWFVVAVVSTLPFLLVAWTVALWPSLASSPTLSPTLSTFQSPVNALFEAMSGITGAGLTMTLHESRLPATLQFWRSLIQWIGGIGIVVLVVSVFEASGPLVGYYDTEIPVGEIRLQPAEPRAMLFAFSVVTLGSIAVLWVLGMSAWAAVNHGLTAVSTGGFTITDASIATYSVSVQAALVFIMVLGAVPVPVYLLALRGDVREFYVDLQSRWLWISVAVGSLAVVVLLAVEGTYSSVPATVRYGVFQFTSGMTCAGFATAPDIGTWPVGALLVTTFRVTNVFFPRDVRRGCDGFDGGGHQSHPRRQSGRGDMVPGDERVLPRR